MQKKDFYNHAVTVFVLKTYRKHIQNLGYPPFPVLLITIMNTRLVGDSHEDSFKPLFLGSGTTPFITDSNCTCWCIEAIYDVMYTYKSTGSNLGDPGRLHQSKPPNKKYVLRALLRDDGWLISLGR